MSKGQFTKGDSRINRNGRPKGSGTRSDEMRTWLTAIAEANWHKLEAGIQAMTDKEYCTFFGQYIVKNILPPPIHDLEKLTDEQLQQILHDLREKRKMIIQ